MNAAVFGRDDRPGHPWARGPHAPTSDAAPFEFCLSHIPMSPCPRAPSRRLRRVPPLAFHASSLLHLCTVSLPPLSTCQLASMSPRASACPLSCFTRVHFCTFARGFAAFAPLHCLSPCPHVTVPTCPLAAITPRAPSRAQREFTFALLHLCTCIHTSPHEIPPPSPPRRRRFRRRRP